MVEIVPLGVVEVVAHGEVVVEMIDFVFIVGVPIIYVKKYWIS